MLAAPSLAAGLALAQQELATAGFGEQQLLAALFCSFFCSFAWLELEQHEVAISAAAGVEQQVLAALGLGELVLQHELAV